MVVKSHKIHDAEMVEALKEARQKIFTEIRKVIIGQDQVIEELLISLLARGHCLLIGVPGLAKTLLISTLAKVLRLKFNRIQFTPDLMPSDITGTEIIEDDHSTGKKVFKFVKGPVFANIVLADEINRTPPKTQAALLQAMQEHEVTAAGTTYKLKEPFFVLATQNPIEQEGTYPNRKEPIPCQRHNWIALCSIYGLITLLNKKRFKLSNTLPLPILANPRWYWMRKISLRFRTWFGEYQ